jgi:hypothetical protein
MTTAEEPVVGSGASAPSERIVFGRGVWSVLMTGDAHADVEPQVGRALPALLRERWSIRATVPTRGGTYFILTRRGEEPQATA